MKTGLIAGPFKNDLDFSEICLHIFWQQHKNKRPVSCGTAVKFHIVIILQYLNEHLTNIFYMLGLHWEKKLNIIEVPIKKDIQYIM